ncbi:hypothetical protein CPB85DRAFT_1252609 [Mucidula mucida]|nr:hypothetical protein CPB85DRAFT_1252609 [Mucidula mucida]
MESKVVSRFARFVFEVEQEFMKTGYFIVDKWLYTPLTGLPPVHLDLTAVYTDSLIAHSSLSVEARGAGETSPSKKGKEGRLLSSPKLYEVAVHRKQEPRPSS